MQNLIFLTSDKRNSLLKSRKGETKFGKNVQLINNFTNIYDDISSLDVDYVIFGVSEDLGVLGNQGNTGAQKAWKATIKVLLNTQSNAFLNTEKILILGHLDYSEQQELVKDETLSKKKQITLARELTEVIDADVTYLVHSIIKAGKTPIIIGGGHNNAYGNIKGASLALKTPINVINFDAHHDFRPLEGRHSGNGFSYAHNEGFLKKYFILGLHENYVSQQSLDTLNQTKGIEYSTYESISIRKELNFKTALEHGIAHVSKDNFGIELDCDAIENVPSSAMTPSGFSVTKARQYVHTLGLEPNATYLHICEAAPTKTTKIQVGKLISYLIIDFIKAHANRNH